jgi:hypothetical protein
MISKDKVYFQLTTPLSVSKKTSISSHMKDFFGFRKMNAFAKWHGKCIRNDKISHENAVRHLLGPGAPGSQFS